MALLILIFGLFLLLPLVIMLTISGDSNFLLELSHFFIILQATYIIFLTPGRGSSLYKVYFVFVYIFFGIIPWMEYKFHISYWNATFYSADMRFLLNIVIITLNIAIAYVYRLYSSSTGCQKISLEKRYRINRMNMVSSLLIISLALISVFIVMYTKEFNILRLVYRGLLDVGVNNDPVWKQMLVGAVIRNFPIIAFIYVLYFVERSYVVKTILLLAALVSTFPLGIPRFAMATLYIPILMLQFSFVSKSKNFALLLLFGMVYIFPIVNQFRWYKEGQSFSGDVDFSFFFEGHFDSYQSLLMVFSENIITFGKQLLGVIFFYAPRSLWSEKPIGSGAEIAKELHLSFDNISANYFAEGYINFGLVGCYIFAIILAFAMAKMDKKMWCRSKSTNHTNFFPPFYLLLLGFLFFILRGDLLSSASFLSGLFFSSMLAYHIIKINFRKATKTK